MSQVERERLSEIDEKSGYERREREGEGEKRREKAKKKEKIESWFSLVHVGTHTLKPSFPNSMNKRE